MRILHPGQIGIWSDCANSNRSKIASYLSHESFEFDEYVTNQCQRSVANLNFWLIVGQQILSAVSQTDSVLNPICHAYILNWLKPVKTSIFN